MSKKGILIALSVAMTQLCIPAAHAAVAQTSNANTAIMDMEKMAQNLDVALGRAIVLGRYNINGLTKTAQALGVAEVDPVLVESLYKKDDQIRADPKTREKESATIKKIFDEGGLHGSSSKERGDVQFLATFLSGMIQVYTPAVDAYCGEESAAKRRPDSALCKDLGLLKTRDPSFDNE